VHRPGRSRLDARATAAAAANIKYGESAFHIREVALRVAGRCGLLQQRRAVEAVHALHVAHRREHADGVADHEALRQGGPRPSASMGFAGWPDQQGRRMQAKGRRRGQRAGERRARA
jgi:hypothetical protein